jgi:hypothetical protein
MAKVIFRQNPNLEQIELERHLKFKNLSDEDRIKETFKLIEITILLGSQKSIKKPEGKGLLLFKKAKI